MAEANISPIRMILPPDGRQTRLDFFGEKPVKKSSSEWWQSISSWFKQEDKVSRDKLEFYAEQLEKEGYSEKSRRSYLFMMKRFFDYFDELDPQDITMGEIEDYNFEFFVSGRYSRSYQLQFINAIKLYYHLTENVDLNLKQLRKTGVKRKTN
jgi:site-specific recombinase XerD